MVVSERTCISSQMMLFTWTQLHEEDAVAVSTVVDRGWLVCRSYGAAIVHQKSYSTVLMILKMVTCYT